MNFNQNFDEPPIIYSKELTREEAQKLTENKIKGEIFNNKNDDDEIISETGLP